MGGNSAAVRVKQVERGTAAEKARVVHSVRLREREGQFPVPANRNSLPEGRRPQPPGTRTRPTQGLRCYWNHTRR